MRWGKGHWWLPVDPGPRTRQRSVPPETVWGALEPAGSGTVVAGRP